MTRRSPHEETQDGVRTLVFDRPEARNAFRERIGSPENLEAIRSFFAKRW